MKQINWKQITLKSTDKVKAGEEVTVLGIGIHDYGNGNEEPDVCTPFAICYTANSTTPVQSLLDGLYADTDARRCVRRAKKQECEDLYVHVFRGHWDLALFGAIGNATQKDDKVAEVIADRGQRVCIDCFLGLHEEGEQK